MSAVALIAEALSAAGGGVTDGLLDSAEAAMRSQRSPVREVLDAEKVSETEFLKSLAERCGVDWHEPATDAVTEFADGFPARLALRYHLVPLSLDADVITLAG